MPSINRVVIGTNGDGKSAVILRHPPDCQAVPGAFWRSTLWATAELPVDNTIDGDRGAGVVVREPEADGVIFRVLELPPDPEDTQKHIEILGDLNKTVKQKYPPTEADMARHPSMHRTDTLDMFMIADGEVYLVTDTDEVLLKAGDTGVCTGVNHAWSNKSDQPCRIVGVMVSAKPLPEAT
jgi:mannose-6-phosphate isomerase-like protein (cupin superfamily)